MSYKPKVLQVVDGGTEIKTTTAYGVLCGGTTATGPFQNAGAGTAGNFLTSNGAAALPSFVALPSKATVLSVVQTSSITNVTGSGGLYFPILFDTELLDVGNNYNPATGIFTAPTTGNYQITANVTLNGLTALHTSGELRVIRNAATYTRMAFNPGVMQVGGLYTIVHTITLPLTATNTISLGALVSGSTLVVGIQGNSSGFYTNLSITFLG